MRNMMLVLMVAIVATVPIQAQAQQAFSSSYDAEMLAALDRERDCRLGIAATRDDLGQLTGSLQEQITNYRAAALAGKVKPEGMLMVFPGSRLSTNPVELVRSGDGKTVQARWSISDADNRVLGAYDVLFGKRAGSWTIRSLSQSRIAQQNEQLRPFCHAPGDLQPNQQSAERKPANAL